MSKRKRRRKPRYVPKRTKLPKRSQRIPASVCDPIIENAAAFLVGKAVLNLLKFAALIPPKEPEKKAEDVQSPNCTMDCAVPRQE